METRIDVTPESDAGHLVRRVLITGGSGFIGTNCIEAYRVTGASVLNLDISPPQNPAQLSTWRQVDILDREAVTRTVVSHQPDTVIHLAAKTDLRGRSLDAYAANYKGVANVIEAIIAAGSVQRSIFASTRLVFDLDHVPRHDRDYRASTRYGQSKALGEEAVRNAPEALGTWTIVRPTGIWGPWFGPPFRDFFRTIGRGWYVHPGKRTVRKSLGYVGNTVHQIQRLAVAPDAAVDRRTMWLADYAPIEVRDWATTIQQTMGVRRIRTVPLPLLKAAAVGGTAFELLLPGRAPLTMFRLNNLTADALYPTDALESVVGPLPHSVEDGVEATVTWLRRERALETPIA